MKKTYNVMGYWDCSICQTKKIQGTERNCPNCGMPRGEDVKFYMDGEEVRLTEEQEKKKGKGADWMCEYCGGYNSALDQVCVSCGAERSGKDYFAIRKEQDEKKQQKEAEERAQRADFEEQPKKKKRFRPKHIIIGLLLAALVICGLGYLIAPKTYEVTLKDKYWQSSVDVEKNTECYESDWTLPSGAELDHTEQEVRTYKQVQHGTKTETYQSYEQVGSHEEPVYTDNGDGTFQHSTKTVPDYEYVTRTREVPNYVSEPVYDTKYYYYIWRWEHDRTLTAEEHGDVDVYYKEETLGEEERYTNEQCTYYLTFTDTEKGKTETYEVNQTQYEQVKTDQRYTIVVEAGEITEIQ